MERDARVVPEMAPSNLQHPGVVFDRVEPGPLVHAGEKPSCTDASTGPEFQKSAARLGCGKGAKQRAGLRLRSHCKAQLPGVAANRIDHCRNLPDFVIIHLQNVRSEEHTSELQSLVISYAVFCLKKKKA